MIAVTRTPGRQEGRDSDAYLGEAKDAEFSAECYERMRRLAADYLRGERVDHTLQATALAHEALLRILKYGEIPLNNTARVVGFAARAMRRILISYAVARRRLKRGGPNAVHLPLDEALEFSAEIKLDLSAVDEALNELERLDPRQAQIVELRFFAGFSLEEVSEHLKISVATVKREWSTARLWLRQRLTEQNN